MNAIALKKKLFHFPSCLFCQSQLMLCQRVTELPVLQVDAVPQGRHLPNDFLTVIRNELLGTFSYQGLVYVSINPTPLLHHRASLFSLVTKFSTSFAYLMNDTRPIKGNTKRVDRKPIGVLHRKRFCTGGQKLQVAKEIKRLLNCGLLFL